MVGQAFDVELHAVDRYGNVAIEYNSGGFTFSLAVTDGEESSGQDLTAVNAKLAPQGTFVDGRATLSIDAGDITKTYTRVSVLASSADWSSRGWTSSLAFIMVKLNIDIPESVAAIDFVFNGASNVLAAFTAAYDAWAACDATAQTESACDTLKQSSDALKLNTDYLFEGKIDKISPPFASSTAVAGKDVDVTIIPRDTYGNIVYDLSGTSAFPLQLDGSASLLTDAARYLTWIQQFSAVQDGFSRANTMSGAITGANAAPSFASVAIVLFEDTVNEEVSMQSLLTSTAQREYKQTYSDTATSVGASLLAQQASVTVEPDATSTLTFSAINDGTVDQIYAIYPAKRQ